MNLLMGVFPVYLMFCSRRYVHHEVLPAMTTSSTRQWDRVVDLRPPSSQEDYYLPAFRLLRSARGVEQLVLDSLA